MQALCAVCFSGHPADARLLVCAHVACLPCVHLLTGCALAHRLVVDTATEASSAPAGGAAAAASGHPQDSLCHSDNPTLCDPEPASDDPSGHGIARAGTAAATGRGGAHGASIRRSESFESAVAQVLAAAELKEAPAEDARAGRAVTCPACGRSTALYNASGDSLPAAPMDCYIMDVVTDTDPASPPPKCFRKKCTEPATSWCRECASPSCDDCFEDCHDSRPHAKLPLSAMPRNGTGGGEGSAVSELCTAHSRPATLYCLVDNTAICDVCVSAHARHAQVPLMAHATEMRASLSLLASNASQHAQHLRDARRAADDFVTAVRSSADAQRTAVQEAFQRMQAVLLEQQAKVLATLDDGVKPYIEKGRERGHILGLLEAGLQQVACSANEMSRSTASCVELNTAKQRFIAYTQRAIDPRADGISIEDIVRAERLILPCIHVGAASDATAAAAMTGLVEVAVKSPLSAPSPLQCTVAQDASRSITLRWELPANAAWSSLAETRVFLRWDAKDIFAELPASSTQFVHRCELPPYGWHTVEVGVGQAAEHATWSPPARVYIPVIASAAARALQDSVMRRLQETPDDPAVLAYFARLDGSIACPGQPTPLTKQERCIMALQRDPRDSVVWNALGAALYCRRTARIPGLGTGFGAREVDEAFCYSRAIEYDPRFKLPYDNLLIVSREVTPTVALPAPYARVVTLGELETLARGINEWQQ